VARHAARGRRGRRRHAGPRRPPRPRTALRLPLSRDRARHRGRGTGGRPCLVSRLDADTGERIRARSLDTTSAGNARQSELRASADAEGYAEAHLWTGIGRARSGAGAAIVGDPDQVLAKLRAYADLGMEAFILSGYPHAAEADLFARHVLPHLPHGPLQARTPAYAAG
jgi:alkanesulfonate monooxygenase SsuD/methylene tetrahydromethanopterin reductase-like flavin-dependent oxidoreductase (luciferase family)